MSENGKRLTVTIIGAGGKMGCRIADNLVKREYTLLFCEKGEAGLARLKEKGLEAIETEKAVPASDLIIMAVPDAKLGEYQNLSFP